MASQRAPAKRSEYRVCASWENTKNPLKQEVSEIEQSAHHFKQRPRLIYHDLQCNIDIPFSNEFPRGFCWGKRKDGNSIQKFSFAADAQGGWKCPTKGALSGLQYCHTALDVSVVLGEHILAEAWKFGLHLCAVLYVCTKHVCNFICT